MWFTKKIQPIAIKQSTVTLANALAEYAFYLECKIKFRPYESLTVEQKKELENTHRCKFSCGGGLCLCDLKYSVYKQLEKKYANATMTSVSTIMAKQEQKPVTYRML